MGTQKETGVDAIRDEARTDAARGRYEPPRVDKSRRLTDVTGQGAVVPSGAPRPVD